MKTKLFFNSLLYSCLLILLQTQGVFAQWSGNPAENNCVTNAPGDQKNSCIVHDGLGNIIIGWRDLQFTSNVMLGGEIYAQKFSAEGVMQWDTNGIPVNLPFGKDSHADAPGMVKSVDGTVIAVWIRWGNSWYDPTILYAQRLDGNGNRLWNNNLRIFNRSGGQGWYKLASDHAGGLVVVSMYANGTWNNTRKDIIAQRISATGEVLWSNEGMDICMAEDDQMNPAIACDSDGSVYIVWEDERRDENGDIYAQKIDTSGTLQWIEDGFVISENDHGQDYPVVISDGKGGAIFAWVETIMGSQYGLHAQRINKSGSLAWGTDGILICSSTVWSAPAMVPDGKGGAIIAWIDTRGEDNDIYAQRIDSSGVTQWGENGMVVTNASGTQTDLAAISDGDGGIMIAWDDFRNDPNYSDIYAQRINGSGETVWQTNGVAVSINAGQQLYPSLVADGEGGAVIVWDDMRVGTTYDIYAQHVDKNGHVGEFNDQDQDGVGDAEEKGPQGSDPEYDGNSDNTPDWQQGNVASFYTYDHQHYVTLSVPDSLSLENVRAMDNPAPEAPGAPSGASAPFGFFSFTITGMQAGSQTVATLYLSDTVAVDHYYKYGPEPGQADHWYEFSYDGETGAEIHADTVFLYLVDGKRGDHDLTANGVIKDPGGPLQIASFVNPQEKERFYLKSIQPNPAGESTRIVFFALEPCTIRIEVFDITGKMISCLLNELVRPGEHTLNWQTNNMTPGIYFLKMTGSHHSMVRKIMISR